MAVDAGADILGDFALEQLGCADCEFHDFHAPPNLALGIRDDFPML
jgi:hypothetical protein